MPALKIITMAFLTVSIGAWANEYDSAGRLVLHQVGKNGKYCISLTNGESQCISGADNDGKSKNVLDMIEKGLVVWQNDSDAAHDMQIEGKNAADLPPQMPGAAPVMKQMDQADPEERVVRCSIHGPMLQYGYRVLPAEKPVELNEDDSHRAAIAQDNPGQAKPIVTTQLSDVSDYVLRKGPVAEVARLIEGRPELAAKVQSVRPEIMFDLAFGNTGKTVNPLGLPVKGIENLMFTNSAHPGSAPVAGDLRRGDPFSWSKAPKPGDEEESDRSSPREASANEGGEGEETIRYQPSIETPGKSVRPEVRRSLASMGGSAFLGIAQQRSVGHYSYGDKPINTVRRALAAPGSGSHWPIGAILLAAAAVALSQRRSRHSVQYTSKR